MTKKHPLTVVREERGLSVRELEAASGVHWVTIHDIEADSRPGARVETFQRLAKALSERDDEILVDDLIRPLKRKAS
jgi:DNA-binding Xre family transcriptional regulator